MADAFARFAHWTANATGTPAAFLLAVATVLVWAATGPLFGWSEAHQLAINTGTTIVTFLMVFVIQAAQNRTDRATQTKLDELLRAGADARNAVMRLEERPEAEAEAIRQVVEEAAEAVDDAEDVS